MKRLYIVMLLFLIIAKASAQNNTQAAYTVYNTTTKSKVPVQDVIQAMTNADIVFYGEIHDDSVGHIAELDLLKALSTQYPGKVALSMEMFETDVQPVLNEYLYGYIREKNFITDSRAWPHYKTDYKPLVEFAKNNNIPVVAANAPARYTNMVTTGGLGHLNVLSKQAKSYLPPLPIDTATGAYYEKFIAEMGGQHGMGNMHIYQSQNLWDATMAWSIARFYKANKGFKIMQVNGGFHSEEKMGIVAQLKNYAPKARVITINAYAGSVPDWKELSGKADYVILTGGK
ncbi:ChaN family lipoprotein [Mucilaginibacter auburnensis]|uniref:Putative iron-regulated protein n=1 Tax=Mucilaginibacter auburnensis TaxID=1457233 RepID=A0A2H9VTM4_9SPHI|nr:ChaN family lipoprotein [Mucilaginibacter auburnensis]PJJ84164.1 putative iron-regulated protein [Mucilaginibacter auburnensis]